LKLSQTKHQSLHYVFFQIFSLGLSSDSPEMDMLQAAFTQSVKH